MSIDFKLKNAEPGIVLSIGQEYKLEDLRLILAPGQVNVYGLVSDKKDALKIGYLNDNMNLPLFLSTIIFNHDNIADAEIRFDEVSKPYIRIKFDKKAHVPAQLAVEIDGSIIGIAKLDTSQKIDRIMLYTDLLYYDLEIVKAKLTQVLPGIDLKPIKEENY